MEERTTKSIDILRCIMIAVVLSFFCYSSSPFIDRMNSDSDCYYLMGKAIVQGKVIYKDIFDNKGLCLYFFNAIGIFLSSYNHIGLWIVETVFLFFDIFIIHKICTLLNVGRWTNYLVIISNMIFELNYNTFQGGNLAETYCLTFKLIAMYYLYRFCFEDHDSFNPIWMFWVGICSAICFFIRPNEILIFGGYLSVFAVLFSKKAWKNIISNLVSGGIGVVVGAAFPLGYCLMTNSFGDMVEGYLLYGFKYVDNSMKTSFLMRCINGLFNFQTLPLLLTVIASLIIVHKSTKYSKDFKLVWTSMLFMQYVGVNVSGYNFGHYYECLSIFTLPVLVQIGLSISKHAKYKTRVYAIALLLMLVLISNLRLPIKVMDDIGITSSKSKQDTEFAKECVNEARILLEDYDNKKLLVVTGNGLVVGAKYYRIFDKLPAIRYIYSLPFSYEDMPDYYEEMTDAVCSGDYDIIIMYYSDSQKNAILYQEDCDKAIFNYLENNYDIVRKCNTMPIEMYCKKDK